MYSEKNNVTSNASSSYHNCGGKILVKNKFESGDTSTCNEVITYLEKLKYTSVERLDRGGFGEILSAVTPKKKEVAIKIVKNTLVSKKEEMIWPTLSHPQVLPLYEIIHLRDMNMKLYLMPKHKTSLEKMIRSPEFLADPNGLQRIRRYLRNTVEGLQYLHGKGFVHFDVKSDNVLITDEDTAVLCDFSGIDFKKSPCKKIIAPYVHRAPESFYESDYKKIDGTEFDIWTYAVMSMNVLTGNWAYNFLKNANDYFTWKANVEPVWKDTLKARTFYVAMRLSLPAVVVTNRDIQLAHDFVRTMLKWKPSDRPTAHQIQQHPFLSAERSFFEKEENEMKKGEIVIEDAKVENKNNKNTVGGDVIKESPIKKMCEKENVKRPVLEEDNEMKKGEVIIEEAKVKNKNNKNTVGRVVIQESSIKKMCEKENVKRPLKEENEKKKVEVIIEEAKAKNKNNKNTIGGDVIQESPIKTMCEKEKENVKNPVLEEDNEYIFSSRESSIDSYRSADFVQNIPSLNEFSAEIRQFEFVPVKRVVFKKKKNVGNKMKVWLKNKCRRFFNM